MLKLQFSNVRSHMQKKFHGDLGVLASVSCYLQEREFILFLSERAQLELAQEGLTPSSTFTLDSPALQAQRFHTRHGRNATISNSGKRAYRANPAGEFNEAVVMSSCSLQNGEIFEICVEKMVDRWSGSIEIGTVSWIWCLPIIPLGNFNWRCGVAWSLLLVYQI